MKGVPYVDGIDEQKISDYPQKLTHSRHQKCEILKEPHTRQSKKSFSLQRDD